MEEKIQSGWSKPTTEVLKNRMNNLIMLFNKKLEYPYKARVLGFPILRVESENDLKSRIRELSEILQVQVNSIAKLPNGVEHWRVI